MFLQVKLAFSDEVAFIQPNADSVISFLFRFSRRITGRLLLLEVTFISFWQSLLDISFTPTESSSIDSDLFLYSNSVDVYFATFTR